jgi:hypothetical protein
MALSKIAADSKGITNYRLEQRLNRLLRQNPSFRNLRDNRDLVLDIIKKNRDKNRRGITTSRLTVKRDMYRLYKDRVKLGLSLNDLDDLRDLLSSFNS